MTVINFNTKKQLQSGYSGDGIDSITLGVLRMPPKSIEFYPEEIIEIASEIFEAELYDASNSGVKICFRICSFCAAAS